MNRFLTVIAALLVSVSAAAQEEIPFQKSWSVELGTGIYPFYMNFAPSRQLDEELADKGQEVFNAAEYKPSITLAGVYRPTLHSEFNVTAQLNWRHYQIRQYPVFGTDPNGKDRYDLSKKADLVGDANAFVPTLTLRYRYIYNPRNMVTLYSGFGLGFVFMKGFTQYGVGVFPDITILGIRLPTDHFYTFAELTIGNVATLAHGGIGWKF